jgi:hypothetical protein
MYMADIGRMFESIEAKLDTKETIDSVFRLFRRNRVAIEREDNPEDWSLYYEDFKDFRCSNRRKLKDGVIWWLFDDGRRGRPEEVYYAGCKYYWKRNKNSRVYSADIATGDWRFYFQA